MTDYSIPETLAIGQWRDTIITVEADMAKLRINIRTRRKENMPPTIHRLPTGSR